jgi:hypothetical protein
LKIILCGPPQSGKSVLRDGLKEAILAIKDAPYPYVITACPDGEGAWFQKTMNAFPDLAEACKAAYKSSFTPEFVRRAAESVQNCTEPLTLVDIGGIPSPENKTICSGATHAIIIAGNSPKNGERWDLRLIPWRKFCEDLNLAVIAQIFSDYCGLEDKIESIDQDQVFRGSVHYLERGEPVVDRPLIRSLAEYIVRMANIEIKNSGKEVTKMAEDKTYTILKQDETTIKVGFGIPAQNDRIVKDANSILETMVENGSIKGGELIKINGPATLPVAMVIAHALGHLYGAVACFDPKLGRYVVSIAHGGVYRIGDLID